MSTPLRRAVERRSAPVVIRLRALPGPLLLIGVLGLLLGGLLTAGAASAALLATVLVLLSWLTFLGWPALAPNARLLRVLTLAAVGAVVVGRAVTG